MAEMFYYPVSNDMKTLLRLPLPIASVEGLNVINDPKRNKVLNVITFCPKCNKLLSCKLRRLLK